jgi:hypothetical protein
MLKRPKEQVLPNIKTDVLVYEDNDYMLYIKDFINIGSLMASIAILDAAVKMVIEENPKQYFQKNKEYKDIINSMVERLKNTI